MFRQYHRRFLYCLLFMISVLVFLYLAQQTSTSMRYSAHPYLLQSGKRVQKVGNVGIQGANHKQQEDVNIENLVATNGNMPELLFSTHHEQKTKELLKYPTNKKTTGVDTLKENTSPRRYILSVRPHMKGEGASTQYWMFKNVIMMALLTNRTLVMTPFFLSGGNVEQGVHADRMRAFNDTFDVNILSKLLPVATIDQYKQSCSENNTLIIRLRIPDVTYQRLSTKLFRDLINVDLPSEGKLIKDNAKLEDIVQKYKDVECLAITPFKDYLNDFGGSERKEMEKAVDKHLVRPPKVRHIVDVIYDQICDGKPYLAYHFRNRTAEMPCIFQVNPEACKAIVEELNELSEMASAALYELMTRESIECIYVACPLWSKGITLILSKMIPMNHIITFQDIEISSEYTTFIGDYYMLSLIEQEIAFRAQIFVSAGFSKWSQIVVEGREAIGRTSYNIRQLAKIPETVHRDRI
ncbi:uncharacterized protein [Ptychodera flava]|uniref:uncharacterized protein n=1 Tax=Ptychodera flava TaxID=63121 RepID=UPI00396A96B2